MSALDGQSGARSLAPVSVPRGIVWGPPLAALLLCALLLGLHLQQQRTFLAQRAAVMQFRQARLDLMSGFSHVVAAGQEGSPFNRAQGFALLRQSVRDFEVTALAGEDAAASARFRGEAAEFSRLLDQWARAAPSDAASAVGLRVAFHKLDRAATALDAESQLALAALIQRQSDVLLAVLLGTLALFASICGLLFATGRSASRAEMARGVAEVKRRESEGREADTARLLSAVAEGTTDSIFVKDLAGRYLFCNPACASVVGRSPAEVIGLGDAELFDAASAEVLAVRDRRVLLQAGAETEEEEVLVRGERRTFLATKAPYLDSRGQVAGVIGISRDITERKRLELELKSRELLLLEAGELAHVGGWGFDPVTLEGDWTPEAARIHDLDPASAMSVSHGLSSFRGEDQLKLDAALKAAIEHGTPYDLELELFTSAGNRKWVRAICNPVVQGGKVVRVRGALQDISERRQAEAEIRQLNAELEQRVKDRTRELEAVNQELEAFSYSVSHDLRAPLRAIDGFSRIVLEDYAEALPAEAQDYLRDVRTSTQHMGQLVDDLLAMSRLSRQEMRRVAVDVERVVQHALSDLDLDSSKVQVHVQSLPETEGDPGLLKQVFVNLLSNAVKYSAKSSSPRVEVGCEGGTYFVKDNGVGFDMRYQHKLFGVFQRLHRAEDYEGTGVGLAIVDRIVKRHGGSVWADSTPGGGATFYFTLGGGGGKSE